MKKLLVIISLIVLILVAACSPATLNKAPTPTTPTVPTAPRPSPVPAPAIQRDAIQREEAFSGGVAVPAPPPEVIAPQEMMSRTEMVAPAPPPAITTAGQQVATDRMIVRTGKMALVVEDVPDAVEDISSMAVRFKGNVVSSNVWQERGRLFGSISIRVPAERFEDAIKALRALAVDVTTETTNSRDVTEEYTDLSAKLKNLEATEQQLLKLMEKGETVKDILDVQRELSNVRSEIERTKARIQYLERTSATSLIEVSLQQSKLNLDFNANKTVIKEREATWFSGDISGGFAPYSYQWQLGDGTTSTEAAFSHTYKNDGKYGVTLTVTDDHGNTVTKTRTDYITVIPGWSAGNIVSSAWNGLVALGRGLANLFIWLVVFIPVWLAIGGIVYGIIYWYRRWGKKNLQL